jgi:hypothetical protein
MTITNGDYSSIELVDHTDNPVLKGRSSASCRGVCKLGQYGYPAAQDLILSLGA